MTNPRFPKMTRDRRKATEEFLLSTSTSLSYISSVCDFGSKHREQQLERLARTVGADCLKPPVNVANALGEAHCQPSTETAQEEL